VPGTVHTLLSRAVCTQKTELLRHIIGAAVDKKSWAATTRHLEVVEKRRYLRGIA